MTARLILVSLVTLAAAAQQKDAAEDQALFGDLPSIEAAALHAQTLAEAPANVTVITADEIRRYGYRTLAEALASVRGFYVTYDHTYHYVGVSGISLPGDFNTRFLVMLNGHPLTDNIYNSNNFFGQDFGLDMDLVERIEIIRGPTSALYGSNGMLANINVVTRSPVDDNILRVSSETDTFDGVKLTASTALYLGRGANLLVSGAGFRSSGEGIADGEHGYHTFANLIWHNWSFTAYFNSRDKQPPIGVGTSLSGDSSQHVVDSRDLVGAAYKRSLGPGEFQWQLYYDRYRYHDRYDYPVDGADLPAGQSAVEAMYDINRGDWVDSEVTYALPVAGIGVLTAGAAGSWDLRAQQYNLVEGLRQNYASHPDRSAALFIQQEWDVTAQWKLYGGVRVDESRNFGRFLSPRIAAVWQRSPRTAYKLVYGRPFRNPSAFEQYYNDGGLSYAAAPALHQEIAETFQSSVERKVTSAWTFVADAFRYRLIGDIEAVALSDSVVQYRNTAGNRTTGGEGELSRRMPGGVELSASVTMQKADLEEKPLVWLANSPHFLAKSRLGMPLFRGALFLGGSGQLISARRSWTGDTLGGTFLTDANATVRLSARCDLVAGLRNLFDRRYEDPIYLALDRIRGDGRSAFFKLVWKVLE